MREKKKKLLKPKEDKQGKYVQCPECKVKIYGDRLLGFHHCQHCGWDSEDNCGKEYAP
jgi:ribosomal protein L37AE/L43A